MYAAVLVTTGCGRLGFGASDSISDAATPDGALVAHLGPCKARDTAPDPFFVKGQTIHFEHPDDPQPLKGVPIDVYDAADPAVKLTSTTSSASDGQYAIVIVGGKSRALRLDIRPAGYLATHQYTAGLLDDTLSGYRSPAWNDTALGSVYNDAGIAVRSAALGTIEVAIFQCDGTPVVGATVEMSPEPEKIAYVGDDHIISKTQTATTGTDPSAVGFHVPVAHVTVTAKKAGLTFDPVELDVGANDNNVIVMHPYE